MRAPYPPAVFVLRLLKRRPQFLHSGALWPESSKFQMTCSWMGYLRTGHCCVCVCVCVCGTSNMHDALFFLFFQHFVAVIWEWLTGVWPSRHSGHPALHFTPEQTEPGRMAQGHTGSWWQSSGCNQGVLTPGHKLPQLMTVSPKVGLETETCWKHMSQTPWDLPQIPQHHPKFLYHVIPLV